MKTKLAKLGGENIRSIFEETFIYQRTSWMRAPPINEFLSKLSWPKKTSRFSTKSISCSQIWCGAIGCSLGLVRKVGNESFRSHFQARSRPHDRQRDSFSSQCDGGCVILRPGFLVDVSGMNVFFLLENGKSETAKADTQEIFLFAYKPTDLCFRIFQTFIIKYLPLHWVTVT